MPGMAPGTIQRPVTDNRHWEEHPVLNFAVHASTPFAIAESEATGSPQQWELIPFSQIQARPP